MAFMGGADVAWIMSVAGKYPVLDIIAIFFAEYVGYILLLLFGIALLVRHTVRERLYTAAFSTLSIIVGFGIVKPILNYFLYRPRPFVAYDITPLVEQTANASFPSGHATLFFTIATLIYICFGRRFGGWAFAIATLIGVARVYAGVHYPLDIIGGASIGILVPFAVRMLLKPELARPRETLAAE
jgi:undecaprenyl-diphosphatase